MPQDGCYLVNGQRGSERCSAVAYYKNFSSGNGNNEQQPDDFVYVSTGSFNDWEAGQTQSELISFHLLIV